MKEVRPGRMRPHLHKLRAAERCPVLGAHGGAAAAAAVEVLVERPVACLLELLHHGQAILRMKIEAMQRDRAPTVPETEEGWDW